MPYSALLGWTSDNEKLKIVLKILHSQKFKTEKFFVTNTALIYLPFLARNFLFLFSCGRRQEGEIERNHEIRGGERKGYIQTEDEKKCSFTSSDARTSNFYHNPLQNLFQNFGRLIPLLSILHKLSFTNDFHTTDDNNIKKSLFLRE